MKTKLGVRLSLLAPVVLLAACNVPKNYPSERTHLTSATHQSMNQAVDQIEGLVRDDRIAVVNLDGYTPEDAEINAMLDDALVNALLTANYTVVERDSEGLRVLVQEGSGQNLSWTVTGHTEGEEDPIVLDAALVTGGNPTRYLVDGERLVEVPPNTARLDRGPNGGDDFVAEGSPALTNDVITATKVLGYRVVDVKVRDYTYKRETYRFANVVVYMRLVDANYGTVLWSGLVDQVVEDKVPQLVAPKLRR